MNRKSNGSLQPFDLRFTIYDSRFLNGVRSGEIQEDFVFVKSKIKNLKS
jgi:hypothetical protein